MLNISRVVGSSVARVGNSFRPSGPVRQLSQDFSKTERPLTNFQGAVRLVASVVGIGLVARGANKEASKPSVPNQRTLDPQIVL